MRVRVLLLCAVAAALAFAPAPLPRKPRDRDDPEKAERLYDSSAGLWRSPDDSLWLHLHRNEKAAQPGGRKWGIVLASPDSPGEYFRDAPARVEAAGDALRIVLPSAAGGEGRRAHALLVRRDGDRLSVQVFGGPLAGSYLLEKARAKH
jgi:hypothetical protein